MEIISRQKKRAVNFNFDDFKPEKELTDKQINRLEQQNLKTIEDELRKDMVLFRQEFLKQVGGKANFLKKYKTTWEEFVITTIFHINTEYADIDGLRGASDYFMSQLNDENTEITWSSYSAYYENKRKIKTVTKSKKSLDNFYTTTGFIMNSNEIDLEIARLTEQRKIAIKNEKTEILKKMKEDIKKYNVTSTDLSKAFKKRKTKAKVKPTE
jgi:hypothetical protein